MALGSTEDLSLYGKRRIESDVTQRRSTQHAKSSQSSRSKLSMTVFTWSKQGGSCRAQCFGISIPSNRMS